MVKYNNWLVKGLHKLTQFGQQMAKLYGKTSTRLSVVTASSTDSSQTLAELEVIDLFYTDGIQKSLVTTLTGINNTLPLKADLVGGLVPTNQLPSYVDDVLEYADYASFPVTGETGKIYYANDTNSSYRWTGSTYYETNSTQEFYLRSSITNSTVGDIIALDTAQKSFLRFTAATTLHSLLGITVTNLNKLVIILNKNSSNLLIKNESLTESTATNRILTGTGIDIELLPNSSIILIYDYNSTRWHIIGGTGSGGGGGSTSSVTPFNFIATAAQTTFTLPITPQVASIVFVFVNGQKETDTNYSIGGDDLIFNVGLALNDSVEGFIVNDLIPNDDSSTITIAATQNILLKDIFSTNVGCIVDFWNQNNLEMYGRFNWKDPNVYIRDLSLVEIIDTPEQVSFVDISGDMAIQNNTASSIILEFRRIK